MKNKFSKWDAGGGSRSIIQSLNLFASRNLFKSLKSILMVVALLSLSSNVWGDTYELYTSSTLTEGDYLIVGYQTSSSNYYAMNNTSTNNQYMGITSVSPSNNAITSTSSAIVWTISASTNGYYIKNGSNILDDNATSSKNYAQLVSPATTTCEWNFAYNSTEKTWTITNYGTSTTKKTLSFNIGSTRVACYASIQSGNTCCYLYKKQSASVPTTITYHVGSASGTVQTTVGASLATAMTGISTTSCDANSTTFMGWSTAPIDGKVQTAPSSLLASDATVTANMEIWAVWAKAVDNY
ncbi:MAG: hypothetical protein KBT27_14860, partial [Prevotellaceae bacterium]|nr:hypothetical protein [Candidatus Faecinaster equi]